MTSRGEQGFSLVETLVAMVLMGVVMAALTSITGQWLPNWRRGFATVQSDQLLARALDRVTADLSAAENVPLGARTTGPYFVGRENSVTFVRGALGPNAGPGLEVVSLDQTRGPQGPRLLRTRRQFVPVANPSQLPRPGAPVTVLSGPYLIQFSYAGPDRIWKSQWTGQSALPRSVRLQVIDDRTGDISPASTVAVLHVDPASSPCSQGKSAQSACQSGAGPQAAAGAGLAAQGPLADQ